LVELGSCPSITHPSARLSVTLFKYGTRVTF
jgi:hypothetical protein